VASEAESRNDTALRFVLKMALRNSPKLVKGLRKQISDIEEDVMVGKLLEELRMSSYEIVTKPGTTGHVLPSSERG
jgi:hypothetical protein